MIKIKRMHYSVTVIYFSILVWISQYFYSISYEIKKNNLKTISEFRSTRILAEQETIPLNRVARSVSSIESMFNLWLEYIQEGFFSQIEKLSSNFTANNAKEFSKWMENKTEYIMKAFNSSTNNDTKSFLGNTLNMWNRLKDELLLNTAIKSYIETKMLNATSNGGNSSYMTENSNGTMNGLSILPSAEENSALDACSGPFCSSATSIGLSVPLAIVGCALFLAFLYKRTPVGYMLGRGNRKVEKRKKRSFEMSQDNAEDPPELLEETGETSPKRSRLNSFLKAFGYKYRKIFPYIDHDITENGRT